MPLNYDQALNQLAELRQSGNLNETTLRELVSSLSVEAEQNQRGQRRMALT